jgi:hypothetical protein
MKPTSCADRLGKVFYPVKSDIEGNIKKLQSIAKTKSSGVTLQALVREEKEAGGIKVYQAHSRFASAQKNPASATHECAMDNLCRSNQVGGAGDSLLWLKRAMQFMNVFLGTVSRGGEANAAAKDAYISTLQKVRPPSHWTPVPTRGICRPDAMVQGYPDHKKHPPPRTLH